MSAEDVKEYQQDTEKTFMEKLSGWRKNMIWKYFFFITFWHVIAFYGFMTFPYSTHKLTVLWSMWIEIKIKSSDNCNIFIVYLVLFIVFIVYLYAVFGLCGGAHRYWSHRSFKAKLPLQIILAGGHYTVGIVSVSLLLKKFIKIILIIIETNIWLLLKQIVIIKLLLNPIKL